MEGLAEGREVGTVIIGPGTFNRPTERSDVGRGVLARVVYRGREITNRNQRATNGQKVGIVAFLPFRDANEKRGGFQVKGMGQCIDGGDAG